MPTDTQWWNEWNERVKRLSREERQREIERLTPERRRLAESLTQNRVAFNTTALILFLLIDALLIGGLVAYFVFWR